MLNHEYIQKTIVDFLEKYLGCKVVCANQEAPMPEYPYVSFTITTPLIANNGTYSEYVEDDTYIKSKEIQQIWSFTTQSNNDIESVNIANKAHDFFDCVGTLKLNENGIVAQRVSNVNNRDNLITIGYEYRNGFDVTFAFINVVERLTLDENSIKRVTIGNVDIEKTDYEKIIKELETKNNELQAIIEGLKLTIVELQTTVDDLQNDKSALQEQLSQNDVANQMLENRLRGIS